METEKESKGVSTQTDVSSELLSMKEKIAEPEEKVESQTVKMKCQLFRLSAIQDDNAKVAFYTGFSS